MTRIDAVRATVWEQKKRALEEAVLTAEEALVKHRAACRHWSTRKQVCGPPETRVEIICEWCGKEVPE